MGEKRHTTDPDRATGHAETADRGGAAGGAFRSSDTANATELFGGSVARSQQQGGSVTRQDGRAENPQAKADVHAVGLQLSGTRARHTCTARHAEAPGSETVRHRRCERGRSEGVRRSGAHYGDVPNGQGSGAFGSRSRSAGRTIIRICSSRERRSFRRREARIRR